MAEITTADPDALPGQSTSPDNLTRIRDAARTKKALLEVKRLEKKIEQEEAPVEEPEPEERKPRIPSPPSRQLSIQQLISYWRGTDQQFRPSLLGYLYRLWPYIQRTPSYIDKLSEPPEHEDDILRQWGTGEYELVLTDLSKTKFGQICKARFKFNQSYVEFPPILEILELDQGRKENLAYIQWLRSKGMLKMPGESGQTNDASATILAKALVDVVKTKSEPTAEDQAVKTAFNILQEATTNAIQTVKAQHDPNGLTGMLNAVKAIMPQQDKSTDPLVLLKTAKDLFAAPTPAVDPRIDILLKDRESMREELAESRKRADALMDKLFDERTNRPQDTFTQTLQEKLMTRAIDLLDGGGVRAAGKFAWLAEYLPGILETVKPVTQGLGILIQRAANRNGTSPTPAQPGIALPAGPQPIPDYVQQGANPDPTQLSPEQVQMALSNFFQTVGPPLRKHLMEGKTGQEFADFLMQNGYLDLQGFTQLKEIGRDNLMGILRQMPAAWANIQPIEKRFTEFLDEFLSWDPNWASSPPEEELPAYLRRKQ